MSLYSSKSENKFYPREIFAKSLLFSKLFQFHVVHAPPFSCSAFIAVAVYGAIHTRLVYSYRLHRMCHRLDKENPCNALNPCACHALNVSPVAISFRKRQVCLRFTRCLTIFFSIAIVSCTNNICHFAGGNFKANDKLWKMTRFPMSPHCHTVSCNWQVSRSGNVSRKMLNFTWSQGDDSVMA